MGLTEETVQVDNGLPKSKPKLKLKKKVKDDFFASDDDEDAEDEKKRKDALKFKKAITNLKRAEPSADEDRDEEEEEQDSKPKRLKMAKK